MAKRIVFLTVMACGIIIIAIAFVSIRKMDSDRTPPTETETETQTSESGNDVRSTTPRQAAIPQDSGRSFHAIDLLNIPEPVEEKLITVDVWSVPIPVPTVYGGISYRYDNLPPRLAVPTKKMGLIFNRMIEDRVCLFDVMSENPDGDFFYGTDHTYGPGCCGDERSLLDSRYTTALGS